VIFLNALKSTQAGLLKIAWMQLSWLQINESPNKPHLHWLTCLYHEASLG